MKYIIQCDLEDRKLLDFLWDEERDPPPLIKQKREKEDQKERESKGEKEN